MFGHPPIIKHRECQLHRILLRRRECLLIYKAATGTQVQCSHLSIPTTRNHLNRSFLIHTLTLRNLKSSITCNLILNLILSLRPNLSPNFSLLSSHLQDTLSLTRQFLSLCFSVFTRSISAIQ